MVWHRVRHREWNISSSRCWDCGQWHLDTDPVRGVSRFPRHTPTFQGAELYDLVEGERKNLKPRESLQSRHEYLRCKQKPNVNIGWQPVPSWNSIPSYFSPANTSPVIAPIVCLRERRLSRAVFSVAEAPIKRSKERKQSISMKQSLPRCQISALWIWCCFIDPDENRIAINFTTAWVVGEPGGNCMIPYYGLSERELPELAESLPESISIPFPLAPK